MISSIDSVCVRAAASSIASGSPSSERHSSETASPAGASRRRADARRVKSSTASGSASGPSSNTASPSTSSGDLARAQDPEPVGGVEEAQRDRRGRVDDVLAVVEDDHRRDTPESLEQGRLATRDVQCGDHRVEHLVRRARRLQPCEPDDAAVGDQPAARRDRDRRLADPAGADDLDEPLALEQLGEGGQLGVAAHEPGGQRGEVPGRGRRAAAARSGAMRDGSWVRIRCSSPRSRGPGSRPRSSASPARTRW